jgi:serine/threonine protein kinase
MSGNPEYLDPVSFETKYPNTGVILGTGTYGEVYRSGDFAIKYITIGATKSIEFILQSFIKELDVYTSVNHPNIIKLINWTLYLGPTHVYGKLAFPIGYNIDNAYKEPSLTFESLASSLLSAVTFLRQVGIVHNDVKKENLVYLNNTVKFIDMGVSERTLRYHNEDVVMNTLYTAGFRDPQAILEVPNSANVELYAVGIILADYLNYNIWDINSFPFRLDATGDWKVDLIRDCISFPVENRLNPDDILFKYPDKLHYVDGIKMETKMPIMNEKCTNNVMGWLIGQALRIHSFLGDKAQTAFLTFHLLRRALGYLVSLPNFDNKTYLMACIWLSRIVSNEQFFTFEEIVALSGETTISQLAYAIVSIIIHLRGIIHTTTYWDLCSNDNDLIYAFIDLTRCHIPPDGMFRKITQSQGGRKDILSSELYIKIFPQFPISSPDILNEIISLQNMYPIHEIVKANYKIINADYNKQIEIRTIEAVIASYSTILSVNWDKACEFASYILYDPSIYKRLSTPNAIQIFKSLYEPTSGHISDLRYRILQYLVSFDISWLIYYPIRILEIKNINPFDISEEQFLISVTDLS